MLRKLYISLLTAMFILSVSALADTIFIDKSTGLMWQDATYTKAEIKVMAPYSDAQIKAHYKVQEWAEAKTYCSDLDYAGFTNWYLPTKSDLRGLYKSKDKLQNIPIKGYKGYYWSSSKEGRPLMVILKAGGYVAKEDSYFKHYVRCVRTLDGTEKKHKHDCSVVMQYINLTETTEKFYKNEVLDREAASFSLMKDGESTMQSCLFQSSALNELANLVDFHSNCKNTIRENRKKCQLKNSTMKSSIRQCKVSKKKYLDLYETKKAKLNKDCGKFLK